MPVHDRQDQVPAVEQRRQRALFHQVVDILHRQQRLDQGQQGKRHEAQKRAAQQAERAARLGDLSGAAEQLRTLEQDWQRRARMLELVAAHDALSDIRGCISDARVCLENNNAPEFRRASAVLAAALERLRTTEAVRLMNLF